MRRFLYKSGLFFFIILILACVLKYSEGDRSQSNEYVAALTDKHHRIEQIHQPKLLLAGGSNLVFGVDSQKIQEELDMPVVNLGLLAKLGLQFILHELEDVAQAGDLIVFALEHDMAIDGNIDLLKRTVYYNAFARKYYKKGHANWLTDCRALIEDSHILFKKTVSNYLNMAKNNTVYCRDGINKYGDGVYHLDLPSQAVLGSKSVIPDTKTEQIELLNTFFKKMQERDVHVVFSYGAYELSEFEKNKAALQSVHRDMIARLQIEMIMNLEDFVYPTSYFYDSVYHLNKKGRAIHTNNLISHLQNSRVITTTLQANL